MSHADRWQPTPAHVRAVLGTMVLAVTAVLARRADLLVVATPLAASAVWGVLLRPTSTPSIHQALAHPTLREGQATTWRVRLADPDSRVEDVAVAFDSSGWIDQQPARGRVAVSLPDDGDEALAVTIRPTRWGVHNVNPALVVASSGWNAFRFVSRRWPTNRQALLTFPEPARFDAAAPPVPVPGLVGANRSPRYGAGSEFATIRPFQPGDRLRRIHWPVSLRTGDLHVTTTSADHDRHVVILVDAFDDAGQSGGIDGRSSSLDIALRAAAAIAEHYIDSGDRVALVAMSGSGVRRLPPASGHRHLRRLLEVMAQVHPANALFDDGRLPRGIRPGALVIMLSPLLSSAARRRLAILSDHGYRVLAIDCLPTHIADDDDPYVGAAWRIERLKREPHLRQIRGHGIAVVAWHGPGSLDLALRGLHHHSTVRSGQR